MKLKPLLFILFVPFWATGCLDFTEEYSFNADKSGRYVGTFDLSRMATMTGKSRQEFAHKRDSLLAIGAPLVVDSTAYYFQQEPDSFKRLAKYPELFSRFKGYMKMDYSNSTIIAQQIFDFKDVAELKLFQEEWTAYQHLLDSLKGKPATDQKNLEGSTDLPSSDGFKQLMSEQSPSIAFDGKNFSMTYRFKPGKSDDTGLTEIMGDESAFARNLLKSFKYNLVFHFPKNVKKVEGAGFTADGKTVSCKINFLELMKFDESGGFNIRVKLR